MSSYFNLFIKNHIFWRYWCKQNSRYISDNVRILYTVYIYIYIYIYKSFTYTHVKACSKSDWEHRNHLKWSRFMLVFLGWFFGLPQIMSKSGICDWIIGLHDACKLYRQTMWTNSCTFILFKILSFQKIHLYHLQSLLFMLRCSQLMNVCGHNYKVHK